MSDYKSTNGQDWEDLSDDDDLRKLLAECERDGKSMHDELKKRGLILDLDKYLDRDSN